MVVLGVQSGVRVQHLGSLSRLDEQEIKIYEGDRNQADWTLPSDFMP